MSPRIGGAETLAAGLAETWSQRHESLIDYLEPHGHLNPAARVRHVRRATSRFHPDVLLTHSAMPNLYGRLANLGRVPVVTVLHSAAADFDDPKLRWAETLLRPATAGVVAVSQKQMSEYTSRFGGRGLQLIPNGVQTRFTQKSHKSPAAVRILTIGRLVRQKNPALWRSVAAMIVADQPRLRFAWVGPIDDPGLAESVTSLGLPEGVELAGPTDRPEAELLSADLLFHPADAEANSIALLEAAATGLPIVCSSAVAATLPQLVPRAAFKTGDPRDAARVLSDTIRNYEALATQAFDAAPEVRRLYGIRSTASKYEELFMNLGRNR